MGFLSPWFLAGAGLVALPLWIHLLRQYRSRPHPFSSLMFFERRIQSSVKHRRLRYLALLALRLALLLLLALAFANPFVSRTVSGADTKKLLVVAIDHSFSMRFGDHLARAKQAAADVLAKLRSGGQVQVIALDSQAKLLTQLTSDATAARGAIDSIQPSDGRSSFGELARSLRNISKSTGMPLEVHLASDLQSSSMPPSFADLRLPAGTQLVFHPAGSGKEGNWTVESVSAPSRVYTAKKERVEAIIAGHGTPAARRTVSLVLDGRVLESKAADVPANGRVQVEFLSLETPHGFHRGEVRLDPGDLLREDDRFPFAVERTDPRRILYLHGNDNRSALFYRSAIESSSQSGFAVDQLPLSEAGRQALSRFAVVVLSDPGALPAGFEGNLRQYVANGGALLVALGPSCAQWGRIPVSGENILETRYAPRGGERFQIAANVDPAHPVVQRANRLEGVQFYQAIRVDPGTSRVIAKLSDGTPLLLEHPEGEGKVLVFASTFDNIANDFPLHASFVPFVEQTALYLAGEQGAGANVAVDSHVALRTGKDKGAAVDVVDPAGARPLSRQEAATADSFQVTREGFYEVRLANGRQELLAVHADRRESDLTPIPQETLTLWQNTGKINPEASPTTPGEPAKTGPYGLWRFLLLAALLIALGESLLAVRYLSVDKDVA